MQDRSMRIKGKIRDCLGLTRAGALAAASVAMVSEARAEPVRVDVNEVVPAGTMKQYDVDGDGHVDVTFDASFPDIAYIDAQDITIGAQTLTGYVMTDPVNTFDARGYLALEGIGAEGDSLDTNVILCTDPMGNFCSPSSPRYAGFRFGSLTSGAMHWAWAEVSVNSSHDIEVVAFGYEREPGAYILAGTPPPVPAGPAVPVALALLATGAWLVKKRFSPD